MGATVPGSTLDELGTVFNLAMRRSHGLPALFYSQGSTKSSASF
jgi:hypothetical protein